jgi:hypothetical protein
MPQCGNKPGLHERRKNVTQGRAIPICDRYAGRAEIHPLFQHHLVLLAGRVREQIVVIVQKAQQLTARQFDSLVASRITIPSITRVKANARVILKQLKY